MIPIGDYANDIYHILEFDEEITKDLLLKISNLFQRYSNMLTMFVEFTTLSNSVGTISNFFEDLNFDELKSKVDLDEFRKLILFFIVDLENWRDSVFQRQDAVDVHFLDEQAESFTEYLVTILNDDDSEDDDDDILLF